MSYIRIWLLLILSAYSTTLFCQAPPFFQEQMQFSRVKNAWKNENDSIDILLKEHEIDKKKLQIFIRAFKQEGILEIWAKNKAEKKYRKLKSWNICNQSGELGPKIKQGDRQVPEGVYAIDRFNPSSNFHLSLGISYPNALDRKRSGDKNPGGDIFIHGSCVTIGCLPMSNKGIEEIYLLCMLARNAGQKNIAVHLFPFRLNQKNMNIASSSKFKNWLNFWENLRFIYTYFENNQDPGTWKLGIDGSYELVK